MRKTDGHLRRICVLLCGTLGCLALVTLTLLLWVQSVALNVTTWEALWDRFDVPALTGMSQNDLRLAGTTLAAYLRGQVSTPQVTVVIDGQSRFLYDQRELAHLRDVRSLYRLGTALRNAMFLLLVFSALGLGYYVRAAGGNLLKHLGYVLLASGTLLLLLSVAVAIPAFTDFSDWWTGFHELSFSNDLWLLDPETEWLVKMFPLEFFFAAVLRIWLRVVSTAIVMAAAGFAAIRGWDGKIRNLRHRLFRRPPRSSRPSGS